MENLTIRKCTCDDLVLLARMNKQLIEDEKHDNRMTEPQLENRMRGFIETCYDAYLFYDGSTVVGYALFDITKNPAYLRQFFICREARRHGYGSKAFHALLDMLGTDTIDIEVLVWNEAGRAFWRSLGFEERSVYMRFGKVNTKKNDIVS